MQKLFLFCLLLALAVRFLLSFFYEPRLNAGQHINFTTTLLSEPTDNITYKSITVDFSNGLGSSPIYLVLPEESAVHYGQKVIISGIISLKDFSGKTETTISHPIIQATSSQNPLLAVAYYLRQKVQNQYNAVLPQKSAALLLGIVLGAKGNFPENFLLNLQSVGVMHVIAASGMNVTMTAAFLLGIFTAFLRRQWAIIWTIAGLLFYCVISGLQASILRATIMIFFALAAQLLGRQYSGLYGLFLAAVGMLLYNPNWLFDVGFQLSFAATLGIMTIKPLLHLDGIFGEDVATTVSAQIATLPILVGSFGTYGLLSILVNALVLWTIAPLMILGGIGALVGLVFLPLGNFFVWICEPLLWFFENMVTYFGNFGWQVHVAYLPAVFIVGYYFLLGSWVLLGRKPIKEQDL